ncbi:autotransporter adhesin Ag43 [Salmonella enterica subsp. enterica serovar Freetown]|nr:autotransporter adhesin Ag43 [Salmonella enterica subsp. enterica serovar Freetown]EBH8790756.1 autotransporter adhesin Ag43 [Salmonella enterica subsp. enterica serovar Freetown]
MKRNLNTSYRLVWNDISRAFVVVSELAKTKGMRTGTVLTLVVAGLTSGTALATETSVPVGETADGVVISNNDTQSVFGEANNTVINTGYEFTGDEEDKNTGGQFVQAGGVASQTTINSNGLQRVNHGGRADDTIVNTGGGQSLAGQSSGTVLNGGEQWIHSGGVASSTVINEGGYQLVKDGAQAVGTVVNTGAQGGPDAENSDGMFVSGTATNTTINENGRQVVFEQGTVVATTVNAGGDQSVHGSAEDTTLNGGYQYVHSGAAATDTVINSGGWQVVKDGAQVSDTTVNNSGRLSVAAGGKASDVIINAGGALVTNTAADVSGTNRLGNFSVDSVSGNASNVVLENGGRLDVLTGDAADTTMVDKGGVLTVNNGGTATNVTMNEGGALIADSGSTVSGTNARGEFSIDAASGKARGLWLENGGHFSVKSGAVAENTTVGSGGELNVGTGGGLSGTTSLTENANLTITGDVVSTGTIENAGSITFAPEQSGKVMARLSAASSDNAFTPRTLTTTNLVGQGGTINMNINLANSDFPADMLVIDGGQATGKTWLNFTNAGDAGLGLATTGNGIKVVDAINGATTDAGAFALGKKLQAGAYNYVLNHGTADENWYLSSEAGYRAEVALYASLFAQSMDYDRALAGSYSQRSAVKGDSGVWGRIQGGHMGHDNNGGIEHGATPESSGSYGFVQLGGDLLSTSSLNAGVYGAAGHSVVDVKDDDRSRAGSVRDDVYSLGGYLTAVHANSGLWADMVAQGSRHNLKASSDTDSFDTHGWGWLASLETGLPFNVTDGLVVEPQLQYIWQGLYLNNGHDNGGYVNFGDGSTQHLRAGLRFGSQSELTFGNGTSTQAGFGDSMKHSVSELPVNWWVRPSVMRTFSTDGDLHMGTTTAGSNVTFTPSQNGTSVDFQAGIDALIRQNVTLGIQGGYTRSVSGNSANGYNGQATLKVAF